MQCTQAEICAFFNCDHKTLTAWVKRYYGREYSLVAKEKAELGNISLRRWQFKQAEHNPTMAIFLGKQYLGQTDKQEVTVAEIGEDQRQAITEFLDDDGTDTDSAEA
jgi:hypothetical protein